MGFSNGGVHCSETFCSFLAASKVDICVRPLWPNEKFKVKKNKHSTTISRHVTSRASEVRELVYSVISSIPGQEDDSVGSAGFTTDIWTNRSLDYLRTEFCTASALLSNI